MRGTPVLSFSSLYRGARYAPDYPGLASLGLRPKGTMERYREPAEAAADGE